jgi:pimeloyl-ACP methyl ester carboxylesterase
LRASSARPLSRRRGFKRALQAAGIDAANERHAADRFVAVLSALFPGTGVAEAEFERNPRDTIRRLLYSGSGDAQRESDNTLGDGAPGMVPRTGGFLTRTIDPPALPAWLTEADIDVFAAEFVQAGFRGGLNWYRNIDRNWELLAPFVGAKVTVPALYMAGDRDLVVRFPGADQLIANLKRFVPNLTKTIMLPGCGHWTQQERASEVNAALIAFLHEVR